MPGRVRPALTAAGALVAGAVVGVSAVAVHAWWWGLALAAAASLALLLALPRRWSTRPAYAVGWIVPLAAGVVQRAEGDYAVAATLRGYGLMVVGLVLLATTVATLPVRRRIPPDRRTA